MNDNWAYGPGVQADNTLNIARIKRKGNVCELFL